jgi:hypothetical protein
MARCGGRAVGWACAHAAQRRGPMNGTRGGNFVRTPPSDGELDRGAHPGVHAAQRGAPVHRAYPAMHARAGSSTQKQAA